MNKRWPNGKTKWGSALRKFYPSRRTHKKTIVFYREERKSMEKFWELLERSTIFQGAITFMLVITTCYLWITGKPVPEQLWFANTVVIGFFFGSKSRQDLGQLRILGKGRNVIQNRKTRKN